MKNTKKTAMVCGSTQGIGKAVAKRLAENGFNIILVARNEEKLVDVLNELVADSEQKHQYLVADFSNTNDFKQRVSEFFSKGNTVDVLVNNSGGPKGGPIIDADISEFMSAFNQHLICNHILVQAVFPHMKANRWGRIVNIISTSVKQPLPNLGVSNTIRGAVGNWSKTLANELGPYNVTVNNVLPGATNTNRLKAIAEAKSEKTGETVDMVFEEMSDESPMKRIAEPWEVAAAVAFLTSPDAAYINGINIPVDGGRTKVL